VIVRISRNELNTFRRRARATRKEIYAMLLGKFDRRKRMVTVKQIVYPELAISTPEECAPDGDDYVRIKREARKQGLAVVGSLHSHPGAPAYMSQTDRDSHVAVGETVSGIVEICGGRTRVAFWCPDTPVPCRLSYTTS
jgi:proteasome lid subunit RPN8/RPN11